jgi:hypothetical protein
VTLVLYKAHDKLWVPPTDHHSHNHPITGAKYSHLFADCLENVGAHEPPRPVTGIALPGLPWTHFLKLSDNRKAPFFRVCYC